MFKPFFRTQPSSSDLTLEASAEAQAVALNFRRQGPPSASRVKLPARVREEARARVAKGGGNPNVWEEMLAESEIQFGQYRGKTFRWLLENDVGNVIVLYVISGICYFGICYLCYLLYAVYCVDVGCQVIRISQF